MTVDWGQAVLIFVLGIGTVFAVLILLWGILAVMGMIFNKTHNADKSDKAPATAQTSNSTPAAKPEKKMSTPKKVASAPPANEDELVAVLNAAAVGYIGSANVRVKSYKKM